MVWIQLKTVLPSLLTHLAFTLALSAGLWFALKKTFTIKIPFLAALAIGATFSIYNSAGYMWSLAQNRQLIALEASQSAGTASQAQQKLSPVELKNKFLQTVEALVGQPRELTTDIKLALFNEFSSLFPEGDKDRAAYGKAIMRIYECQKFLFEDALASKKYGKLMKSKDREACESEDGSFFQRERLIPPEIAANNTKLIEELLSGP
ncbi:MAG: hypothetical protein NDI61_11565, partial [Bdellovibrionaceae bacterium]|nr:hypothetical protein [Pseudobdellovibrionaceae bacterium]